MDPHTKQLFIRNEQGRVWGPLSAASAGQLVQSGEVQGKVQVSEDGVHFADAPSFPRAPTSSKPGPPPRGAAPIAGPGAMAAAARAPSTGRQRVHSLKPDGKATSAVAETKEVKPAPVAAPEVSAKSAAVAPPVQAAASSGPVPIPASGTIAEDSPISLYYRAASGDLTGLFSFECSDRTIDLFFRKGNPEYVGSSHPDDAVEIFLVAQGACTHQQVAAALPTIDRFGGELVGALMGAGILNPGTVFPLLVLRAQQLWLKVLSSDSGRFTFEGRELPAHRLMPMGQRWAVLFETVRRLPVSEIRRKLQPYLDLPIMKSGGRVGLAELRLTAQETRALAHIDGVRSLNLLAHNLPQEADHFFRLAFALKDMEMVSFSSQALPPPLPSKGQTQPAQAFTPFPSAEEGATPPAPATPKPAPPPPQTAKPQAIPAAPVAKAAPAATTTTKAASAPAAPTIELPALRERVAQLKSQNHFEVLGVSEKAEGTAIKVAYFKLAKVHHPDTVPATASPEFAQLQSTLFSAIGEAYRTLSDDKARAEYVDDLKHGGTGEKYDVGQLFQAEEMFQKACIMVKARKWQEGMGLLDEAIRTNPAEGEFYAWRAWAWFHTQSDRARAQVTAQKEIQDAISKNPRCAPAYFFLGNISKAAGDLAAAQKHFKKVVELQPDHIDAQRELRMMTKK